MVKNIFKSFITTTLGIVTATITLLLLWKGNFSFIWDGLVGLIIASILILSPDKIITIVIKFISKNTFGKKQDPPVN